MTTKIRRGFSMVVAAVLVCWAGTAVAGDKERKDQDDKGGLPLCQAHLKTCNAALAAAQQFPATGQTISYTAGDDGAIQAGATLSYTDNGDGTVTDNNTKLVWEKKSDDGSIHDKDTIYTWADAFAVHIAGLNAAGGFAGHTDWRLPNVKELQSSVNYETFSPAVSTEFNTGCAASCTVLTCSCTAAAFYWSSSTFADGPSSAWGVDFVFGLVSATNKGSSNARGRGEPEAGGDVTAEVRVIHEGMDR